MSWWRLLASERRFSTWSEASEFFFRAPFLKFCKVRLLLSQSEICASLEFQISNIIRTFYVRASTDYPRSAKNICIYLRVSLRSTNLGLYVCWSRLWKILCLQLYYHMTTVRHLHWPISPLSSLQAHRDTLRYSISPTCTIENTTRAWKCTWALLLCGPPLSPARAATRRGCWSSSDISD